MKSLKSNLRLTVALAIALANAIPHVAAENLPAANATLLYGYNDVSEYNTSSEIPAGIYSFQAAPDADMQLVADVNFSSANSIFYGDGKYFVFSSSWWGPNSMSVYDATTGWQLSSCNTEMLPTRTFAVNPDGSKGYFCANQGWDSYLFEMDLINGESTAIYPLDSSMYYVACAFGPDGRLYFFNTTNFKMHAIDISTGVIAEVGSQQTPDFMRSTSAWYDKHDDVFYATTQADYNNVVYSIDPTTAASTLIGQVPCGATPLGIHTLTYPDNVPDAVSNVDFAYSTAGGSEATLSFNLPATDYSGNAISGDITASVTVDGSVVTTKTAEAGSSVTIALSLGENATHIVSIVANIGQLTSPVRRFSTYTGIDAPAAVTDLTFEINTEGEASLSWKAPEKSVNGGIFDKESLTYDIVRNPGAVTVSTGINATSFTEQLSNAFGHYTYTITPIASGISGTPSTTESITWGTDLIPPFVESFDDWNDFNRYTVVNPLNDGNGWYGGSGEIYSYVSATSNADYWIFTPHIDLDADQTYTVAFDMRNSSYDGIPARIEVGLFSAPEISADITGLFPATDYAADDTYHTYVRDMNVTTSGKYYIGFHCLTSMGGAQTHIDNITVAPNAAKSAPGKVTELSAIPGEKGALTATISFVAPASNFDGTQIDAVQRIEISRYGTPDILGTIFDITPGSACSWTDTQASDGTSIYAVTPWADGIKGTTSYITVTVGNDIPATVNNLHAVLLPDGTARIEWETPSETGANGGYVDTSALTYKVTRFELDSYYKPVIGSDITGLSFTDTDYQLPDGATQATVCYQVIAVSDKGEGSPSTITFTLGEPYKLPFAESFTDNTCTHDAWSHVAASGKATWSNDNGETSVVQPQDNDKGMIRFTNSSIDEASATIWSPRIAMMGLENELSFMMYHSTETEPEDINLIISVIANDATPEVLDIIPYNNNHNGWMRHGYNLGKYAEAGNIIVAFTGTAADGSASIFIDNFKIAQKYDNDVEISGISIPAAVKTGENFATVNIANIGKRPASFKVSLYKNDMIVSEQQIDALETDAALTLSLNMHVTMSDALATLEYRAEAVMDNDEYPANNVSSTMSTFVKRNTLPCVELEGSIENATVSLEWDAPAPFMAAPVTDSFEDYAAYALNNFGGWITVDVDATNTQFSKYWNTITNARAPMAWEVWDNDQLGKDGFFDFIVNRESFSAHSGHSALINFTAVENSWLGEVPGVNDDWLISPEVVGGTDMSFWMKSLSTVNPETIELYYTTASIDESNPDISLFTLIDSYSLMGDWRQVTTVLPADTKRFAIRHCTQSNGYITMLDDFEFTPLSGELAPVTINGYNVYRNDVLIASVNEPGFTDTLAEAGDYNYYVTTVCSEGESGASNIYVTKYISSITPGSSDNVKVSARAGSIDIKTASATRCTVYTTNGNVIFEGTVKGNASVAVIPGVYIVATPTSKVKILVK